MDRGDPLGEFAGRRTAALRAAIIAAGCLALAGIMGAAGWLSRDGASLFVRIPQVAYYRFEPTLSAALCALSLAAWFLPARPAATCPLALSFAAAALFQQEARDPEMLLFALPLLAVAAWVVARIALAADVAAIARWLTGARGGRAAALVFGLLAAPGVAAYQMLPYVVDSVAEVFQARIFRSMRFALDAPPVPEFWNYTCTVISGGRWFAQYPPMHIVWIAILDSVGAAWLVNAAFGAASVPLLFSVASRLADRRTAFCATALFATSPFFVVVQSGMMSHGSMLFFLLAAARLAVSLADGPGEVRRAVVLGVCAGIACATRPLTALAAGLPMLGWFCFAVLPRLQRPGAVFLAGLAGTVPAAALVAFHNAGTTGDPFTWPYMLYDRERFFLGFADWFTPLHGITHSANNLLALNRWLFAIPCGGLLFAAAFLVAGKWRREDAFVAALAAGPTIVYMFYSYQDHWYGPRFLYEVAWCYAYFSARAIVPAVEFLARRMPRRDALGIAACFALSIAAFGAAHAWKEFEGIRRVQRHGIAAAERARAAATSPSDAVYADPLDARLLLLDHLGYPRGPIYPLNLPGKERLERRMPDRHFIIRPGLDP